MKTSLINKIWSVVGLALAYFCVTAWTATQGGDFGMPGVSLSDFQGPSAAIFGILLGAPGLVFMCHLGKQFQRRAGQADFFGRVPRAFDVDLDLSERLARQYQGFFLFAFIAVPALTQVHLVNKLASGCSSLPGCFWPPQLTSGFDFYGVDFVPFIQPVLLIGLASYSVLAAVLYFFKLKI